MRRVTILCALLLFGAGLLPARAAFGWCETAASAPDTTSAEYLRSLAIHRRVLEEALRDPVSSPLPAAELAGFEGPEFYPVDVCYALPAVFDAAPGVRTFDLPTFDGAISRYREYGTLSFAAPDGTTTRLILFQRADAGPMGELTVIAPFRDQTNGEQTYSGGRYLKYLLPLPDPLRVDFNRAVNPACAYNANLPCPIPPESNWLPFAVPAGERAYPSSSE